MLRWGAWTCHCEAGAASITGRGGCCWRSLDCRAARAFRDNGFMDGSRNGYTLKRNSSTSPSRTRYSRPSTRIFPASFAPASPLPAI